MKPAERRKARIYALQALYAWEISQNSVSDIEDYFFKECDMQHVDVSYFKQLFRGVSASVSALDKQMIPFLDRTLKELSPVELCVMRIAIYEFLNCPDVPYRVVINEALELTKQFGATDGFKYVNGVLDQVWGRILTINKST